MKNKERKKRGKKVKKNFLKIFLPIVACLALCLGMMFFLTLKNRSAQSKERSVTFTKKQELVAKKEAPASPPVKLAEHYLLFWQGEEEGTPAVEVLKYSNGQEFLLPTAWDEENARWILLGQSQVRWEFCRLVYREGEEIPGRVLSDTAPYKWRGWVAWEVPDN